MTKKWKLAWQAPLPTANYKKKVKPKESKEERKKEDLRTGNSLRQWVGARNQVQKYLLLPTLEIKEAKTTDW